MGSRLDGDLVSERPSSIETQATELEQWAASVRIDPRALREVGDPDRRAREMRRSLASIVDAAMLRAREAEATDPLRAARIIMLVQSVQRDQAELFAQLAAGEPVSRDEYNGLWHALLTVTSQMGDALPDTEDARQTVHRTVPGGAPTRLPTARGERRPSAPRSSSSTRSQSDDGGGGWFLALGVFGLGAGIAAAARARRGRA